MKKMLGIIGGMGAYAGLDLLRYALSHSNAVRDEDFPNILFHNLPIRGMNECGIVDKKLVKSQLRGCVERMESYGCDTILIACNTVHVFHSELQGVYSGVLLNMVDLACSAVGSEKRIGLMCSRTSISHRLYQDRLERNGKVVIPCERNEQCCVDRTIDCVIRGESVDIRNLMTVFDGMKSRGAESVIIGCTELPLALKCVSTPVPTIDAGRVSVDAALSL